MAVFSVPASSFCVLLFLVVVTREDLVATCHALTTVRALLMGGLKR